MVTGKHFAKYMDSFWPYMVASLQNHEEYSVCAAAVGIIGDICSTFGPEMINFSDKLMELLIAAVSVSWDTGVNVLGWAGVFSIWHSD